MLTNKILGSGGTGGEAQLFNAIIYTGNGTTSRSITGVGFKPDLVWIKSRSNTENNILIDSVRGVGSTLVSNSTAAQVSTDYVDSLDADGFTLGSVYGPSNTNSYTYAAWCFKAGGTPVTNTDGTITSSVSANPDAGFSVVTYTGSGTSNNTIGHGLSQTPEFVVTKVRTLAGWNWYVGMPSLGADKIFYLNSDAAVTTYRDGVGAFYEFSQWNSSVYAVYPGSSGGINNSSHTYVSYCFHSVDGMSKIGTYSGTGSDRAITGLGFQPSFVMVKKTNSTGNWCIADDVRLTAGESHFLYPNGTFTESASAPFTMETDGFSMDGGGTDYNASGSTYLYMAFKGVD